MRRIWLAVLPLLLAADWPEFRGPGGAGTSSGPALPTEWGPQTNLAWATPIPGLGWSSPVLVGDKLFVTTAVPDQADKPSRYSLRAIALDANSGKVLWNHEIFVKDLATAPTTHRKNSHASPTPVADDKHVWVHFGPHGTACLTHAGEVTWKSSDHPYDPVHGGGASPILEQGLLIFPTDGKENAALVALDAKTGQERWRTPRDTKTQRTFSFATCTVADTPSGRIIISAAADACFGVEPLTGKVRFRVDYPKPGFSLIARPVIAGDLVVISTGYLNQRLMAFPYTGRDNITSSVKWEMTRNAPNTPTPVVAGGEIYVVADNGILSCLDAATGKVHYAERLAGRAYSSSPVILNGKLYITSEDGIGQVLELGTTFNPISKSQMGEKTFATIVPGAGGFFLRSETKLSKFIAK